MIEFFDMDMNEMNTLEIIDIVSMETNANGTIFITNNDGLVYETESIIFK